jgi:hypothetical protein
LRRMWEWRNAPRIALVPGTPARDPLC